MKVGLIGLGAMGRPMAEGLLAAGHSLVVWNRTPDRAELLREKARGGGEPDCSRMMLPSSRSSSESAACSSGSTAGRCMYWSVLGQLAAERAGIRRDSPR